MEEDRPNLSTHDFQTRYLHKDYTTYIKYYLLIWFYIFAKNQIALIVTNIISKVFLNLI